MYTDQGLVRKRRGSLATDTWTWCTITVNNRRPTSTGRHSTAREHDELDAKLRSVANTPQNRRSAAHACWEDERSWCQSRCKEAPQEQQARVAGNWGGAQMTGSKQALVCRRTGVGLRHRSSSRRRNVSRGRAGSSCAQHAAVAAAAESFVRPREQPNLEPGSGCRLHNLQVIEEDVELSTSSVELSNEHHPDETFCRPAAGQCYRAAATIWSRRKLPHVRWSLVEWSTALY